MRLGLDRQYAASIRSLERAFGARVGSPGRVRGTSRAKPRAGSFLPTRYGCARWRRCTRAPPPPRAPAAPPSRGARTRRAAVATVGLPVRPRSPGSRAIGQAGSGRTVRRRSRTPLGSMAPDLNRRRQTHTRPTLSPPTPRTSGASSRCATGRSRDWLRCGSTRCPPRTPTCSDRSVSTAPRRPPAPRPRRGRGRRRSGMRSDRRVDACPRTAAERHPCRQQRSV